MKINLCLKKSLEANMLKFLRNFLLYALAIFAPIATAHNLLSSESLYLKDTHSLKNPTRFYKAFINLNYAGLAFFPQRQLPVTITPEVVQWLEYFKKQGRFTYIVWHLNSLKFRNTILPILETHQVPKVLFYLAMVESGYKTRARSNKRAVGPWQIVKGTGVHYGLSINQWIDERKDPSRSTHAAAAYLLDLYSQFDDWYLAFAAYNTGPGMVRRAIRKHNSRNFWHLIRQGAFSAQTRQYVPKILAAYLIGENPETHGFYFQDQPLLWFPTSSYTLKHSVSLPTLAKTLKVKVGDLKDWNPSLQTRVTPRAPFSLNLPKEYVAVLNRPAVQKQLSRSKGIDPAFYYIKKRDTLANLARRFHTSIAAIKKFNPGLKPRALRIGSKLIIPSRVMDSV